MSAAIANVTTHFTMRQQGFHGTAASEDLDNSSLKYYCTLEGYYCKISYFCWLNRTSTIEKAFRYIKIFLWKTIIYIIYKDSKNWHKTYKMFLEGWYRQRRSSWKDSFGLSTFFHTRIWYPGGNCPVAVLSSAVWCVMWEPGAWQLELSRDPALAGATCPPSPHSSRSSRWSRGPSRSGRRGEAARWTASACAATRATSRWWPGWWRCSRASPASPGWVPPVPGDARHWSFCRRNVKGFIYWVLKQLKMTFHKLFHQNNNKTLGVVSL